MSCKATITIVLGQGIDLNKFNLLVFLNWCLLVCQNQINTENITLREQKVLRHLMIIK